MFSTGLITIDDSSTDSDWGIIFLDEPFDDGPNNEWIRAPYPRDIKRLVRDANPSLICKLCQGYLVDVTTIKICGHICKYKNLII